MALSLMSCIALLVVILSMDLTTSTVNGGRIISKEMDQEYEELLKIREKSNPIKIIKTQFGDIYDCFDVHKQPSLFHPLLKNHTVQMEPSSYPTITTQSSNIHTWAELINVPCPKGTVPIQRLSKEDLIRNKIASRSHVANIHPQTNEQPGKHFDIFKAGPHRWRDYYGVTASINLQNLTVGKDQSSSAQMWIEETINNKINSLQAGWIVSPALNGDSVTRLFGYWHAGDDACFNHFCNAFTQVDSQYPINTAFSRVSEYGGQQYVLQLSIFKDPDTGNWWLQVNYGKDGSKVAKIGYWAKDLVPNLDGGASYVAYGGLATGTPNGPSPPLGNGHPFDANVHDFTKQSYFSRVNVYERDTTKRYFPGGDKAEIYVNNASCYGLKEWLYAGMEIETLFTYGGPGGDCGL